MSIDHDWGDRANTYQLEWTVQLIKQNAYPIWVSYLKWFPFEYRITDYNNLLTPTPKTQRLSFASTSSFIRYTILQLTK